MKNSNLSEFLETVGKLKTNTRHVWNTNGRQESISDHSHRLSVMALTLNSEPDIDYARVLEMCVVHDIGEALTGDIPAFLKTEKDETCEFEKVCDYFRETLPSHTAKHFIDLFEEMALLSTKEAKYFKALDKLEAVMSHNEGGIETWLPLEYELQLNYGVKECEMFPELAALRDEVKKESERLIAIAEKSGKSK